MAATTIFTIPDGETFQSFTQLNNILIVITDINRYFLIWDYDDEEYTELEDIPVPLMYFEGVVLEDDLRTPVLELDPGTGWDSDDNITQEGYYDTLMNHMNSILANKLDNNLINGYFLIRTAYKLYDGSYIKHSQPYITLVGDGITKIFRYPDGGDYFYVVDYIEVGKIQYCYKFSLEQKNILEKYRNMIKSLDVFITKATDYYNWSERLWGLDGSVGDNWGAEGPVTYNGNTQASKYTPPTNPYLDDIIKEINYYLIDSIDIEELINEYAPTSLIDLNLNDFKNLFSKETLPVDNFSHHAIWGNKHYNYNSRLHFGNITTRLFSGFNPFYWDYSVSNNSSYNYAIKVWIRTDQGDKIVTETFDTPIIDTILYLNSILAYPDSRAYKIRILQEDTGSYYHDNFEYDLTPHPFLNFSYCIVYNLENPYATTVDQAGWTQTSEEDMTESKLLLDTNRVQVSKLDNALVYEAANSYQIGNDDETIIGFGSAVEPLSDGQFGQFPLYVFTTAGIFVLELGSGDILYSNVVELNGEVCNNALSITDIGGGVVYSTEKGLNILIGKSITEISSLLKGTPSQYLVDNDSYQDYLNDANFVQLLSDVSTVDFLTYLLNAVIGFDYKNKEIIVSNDTYTFSYVYNIETKTWHKIKEVYEQFVKVIPDTYGYKDGVIYNLKDEEDEYNEVMIQTRPIKFESGQSGENNLSRKSIERLFLRGYFNVKDLTYSGLYIFGSIDGKNYVFLRGKTPQDDNTFHDILIKKTHYNFKYLIVVFAGQLKDSSINFIEAEYFERWNNKLR